MIKYERLLKGLQIREFRFSEIYRHNNMRLDSEFLTQVPLYHSETPSIPIGQALENVQYGISIEMNEEGVGTPIYRMNEIDNIFCKVQPTKFARIAKNEIERFKLNDRDVLFNRTNSLQNIGKTGLYRLENGRNAVFASYLLRLVTNEKVILPEYLVAFLNSKFGVLEVRRRSRQSVNQVNINIQELKEILVPILSLKFQSSLKTCFEKAFNKLQESFQKMAKAQELLNAHIGIDRSLGNNKPNYEIRTLVSSLVSTGRLDSEFYTIDYLHLSKSDVHKVVKLSELCTSIFRLGQTPLSDLQPHDVLVQASGKSSIVALNENGFLNKHTLVLKTNERLNPFYLMLFLNSLPGQIQLNKWQSGTHITIGLMPSQIAQFDIPILDMPIQERISQKIQSSHRFNLDSQHLQNMIKSAVELAIEQGESAAENFLALQLQNFSL